MSANTLRMALDLRAWTVALIGLLYLMAPLVDAAWLNSPGDNAPLIVTVMGSFLVLPLTLIKLPVWRLLPVSRVEIARAQWWQAIGAPFVIISAAMLCAVAVTRHLGWTAASGRDALALLGGQLAFSTAYVGILFTMSGISRAFGRGVGLLLGVPLGLLMVAAMLYASLMGGPTAQTRPWYEAGGVLAVVAGVGLYVLAGWRPMAFPSPDARPAPTARSRAKPGVAKPGPVGWRAFATVYARALCVMIAVLLVGFFLVERFFPDQVPQMASSFLLMSSILILMLASLAGGMLARSSIRALAGLPIKALHLAAILFSCNLVTHGLGVGVLYLAYAATGRDPGLLPAGLAILLGAGGASTALILRTSNPVLGALGVQLIGFVVIALSVTLTFAVPHLVPAIIAGGLTAMALGWITVWRQIRSGRHVYRPWPMAPARWRGMRD